MMGDVRRMRLFVIAAAVAGGAVGAACSSGPGTTPPPEVPGGNPARGVAAIERFGCGSCHIIPGVRGADGKVGPPLIHWSERSFVGGEVPNNAQNLIRWIMDPPTIEPGTAMPRLGVSASEARDIAAYLFTLH
jgi:cytochrome c2